MRIIINMLSKKSLLFCLLLFSLMGNAQSFTLTLANQTSTSNTFEFDLMLTVPTGGKRVASVSCGVNFNAAILNGGTPATTANTSFILVPGSADPIFSTNGGLNPVNTTFRGVSTPHLRIVQVTKNPNQMDLPAGVYRFGTFRFTNTVNWAADSNANLWISPTAAIPSPGGTNAIVASAPFGSTASPTSQSTTTSPALILTHTSTSTFSVPLNAAPPCPTAAAASNLVAESPCAGAANGSATITLTGAPSPTATVSYTVDGGGAQNATMSASAFTVSGLSAGNHTVTVTYPGCTAVSTSSFTIDAGAPLTTNGSVTTSICDGDTYVWAANGQSYTTAQSGTTFVSGCNTATLNLSITPATTDGSVTTSICEGATYVWPANGQSYTTAQSGTTFVDGCNTATLNLSITPATTTGSETVSICGDSYTWALNGQTYNASGSYDHVVGCNTATLTLTLTPNTTNGSVTTSICDGATYVWPANGQSYTTAQTGTTFVDGCNTATLNLSITPNTTTGSESVTACGSSYTWALNGQSYNASGTYTHVVGCNTATLTLTLNTEAQIYYADTDGDGFGAGAAIESCTGQPANTSTNNTDCDPNDATKWRTGSFFVDADGDGYNNGFPATTVCYGAATPAGYVAVNNGTDCDDNSASVNSNASEILGNDIDDNCDGTTDEVTPTSYLIATSCGVTLTNLSNTLFAYPLSNFVSQTGPIQGYRFRVTNGAQVRTFDSATNSFALSSLPGGAAYGTTYTVEVSVKHGGYYRAYGSPCSVTTPLVPNSTSIASPSCGSVLTDINNTIFATQVPSASGYRFRVSNGSTIVGTVDTSVSRFSLASIAGIQFGTTYTVEVLLAFGGVYRPDTEYGPACSISTPATPGTSRVIQPTCGGTISTFWTTIFAQQVSGAQGYKFVVTNGAQTREYATANPRFALANLPGGAAANTAYTIRVDVLYNSSYVQGTQLCTLTTTPGASRQTDSAISIYDVDAYPNPSADTFKLNVNTSSENTISVKVYDMLGREVESRQDSVEAITNLEIGSRYPSGVYNIIVTQGENVKTLRVIKR
ncbi:T9SS type A sorting domain-containing protein [Flavobacterium sp. CYK-4]|uniref:T9SS type A sorting domain-containing protein n=1 Tax=Flavobacterium lotistagni TaxID=2709660 RepID=UPI001408F7CB|nr:T9SS type A sorting domain-containing protein [Flavobacterium lotistagni]NHM07664.1 T9SS type A sorting domain-containing protein [Flavobacterium lotistagni]